MSTTTTSATALTSADVDAQAERDKVGKAIRLHADRKRADHGEVMLARAEAVVMATSYTELDWQDRPVVVTEGLYSTADVLGWIKRALEMGAAVPRIGGDTVERVYRGELVPNAIFREEVERRGVGMKALADRIGMERADGCHVTRDLARQLGMETTLASRGYQDTLRVFVTYDQALALAKALDLEPYECGV